MSYLASELSNLLLGFTKDSSITDQNKLVISKDYSLNYNETNRDIAVDSVRYSIINNGIYQTFEIINDLPNDAKQNFKFEAYDGILKMVNFVLLPSPFPLKYYEKCCISSTILTEVVDEMSVNLQLLNELFKPILKYDKFVRDLLSISNEVYGPGGRNITEDLRTHISRSDYFIHVENLDRESYEREFCRYCQYDHCLCHFGRTATSGNLIN
nr:glutathione synthetase [Theileria orientalis]